MGYPALRFDAGGADADAWSDALLEAGALSVDVSDPRAGTRAESPLYAEPGGSGAGVWPVARLAALFPSGADAADAVASAARRLGRAVPPYECYVVAEQDWVRATQAQFAPIRITGRLWIVPSWCAAPEPDAVNVALDPGLAFGTGSHPTTRLCLAWLATQLRSGERVLDYGCGSGILAIAAASSAPAPSPAWTSIHGRSVRAAPMRSPTELPRRSPSRKRPGRGTGAVRRGGRQHPRRPAGDAGAAARREGAVRRAHRALRGARRAGRRRRCRQRPMV
jgi:hypothetical protein